MKKNLHLTILLVGMMLFGTPLLVTAQEIECSPACQQPLVCNGDTGTCVASLSNSNSGNSQTTSNSSSGFVPLAPIPGLTQGVTANTAGLATFFNNLYKYTIGMAAALAVIMIIWGGLEISTQDSISKKGAGKEKIQNAILGLVLVLSPALVFSIINPSILNLSLNLPALNTTSGNAIFGLGSGTGTQTTTSDAGTIAATTAGCTVTGTLLKTAICPTQKAAEDFAGTCTNGSGNVPFFTTDHKATCGTNPSSTDFSTRYAFLDTSQSTSFLGYVNAIVGYSHYEPLASTPANANNGSAVIQFASSCTADGGTTCMSAIKIPIPVDQCTYGPAASRPSVSYCWGISLSCTYGSTGAGGCSSSPQFTVIP